MTTSVQRILKSPDAPSQLKALQDALMHEAKERQVFYNWIDEGIKAEFINGQIVIHSPVKKEHWQASDLLSRLLSFFTSFRRLGRVGVEKVMISLTRNDYEPDIVFFNKEKASAFSKEQVLFPAPDFIVEILSKKTATADRTTKKIDYAAHGVQEYWIIDPIKQSVEQYLLLDKTDKTYFQPYIYSIDDIIESPIIEGFNIPIRAIFDEEINMQTLENLIKKPD